MNNDKRKMIRLGKFEGIDFYRYTPTLLQPYFMDYPKQEQPPYTRRVIHKVRMMLEYLRGGYQVIYMVRDHNILGHIVVAPGGRRLQISTPEDIVIGPIWVSPTLRGQGIGTIGIRTVLKKLGLLYRYAYEFIAADNTASIRTVEKNGYVLACRVKESGFLRNLVASEGGEMLVYRYEV